MSAPLELSIERSAYGGEGVAHLDGKTCFVEGALPGERVLARVTADKGGYLKARVFKVLKASPHRTAPSCRYAKSCGGCQYQHVTYEEELRLKQAQVTELLTRAGWPADKISGIVASPSPERYRNSLTVQVVRKHGRALTGYYGQDNTTLVPVVDCPLLRPELVPYLSVTPPYKDKAERLTYKVDADGRVHPGEKPVFIRMALAGRRYLVPAGGFFQVNEAVASEAARRIAAWVGEAAPERLLDLYAGVGTLGLLCLDAASEVVFAEEHEGSVEALRMNIAESGAQDRLRVVTGRVEHRLEELTPWITPRSVVLVDPPRKGLAEGMAVWLARSGVQEVLYLSCDPSTLARDIRDLLQGGVYEPVEALPLDMFPRTRHIETLVRIRRRG
ncbi:MAG: 23S rRNA (uracil(1939)-C(5))-methyltransferase RlmD [Candidatus Omnitrophica bacterium]|nr:23S rRNA (uracil(1939)-C(5))-methyltransferase RlmD [Candidatus Omnitrophota bacterium]